jgi:hypothetical protein
MGKLFFKDKRGERRGNVVFTFVERCDDGDVVFTFGERCDGNVVVFTFTGDFFPRHFDIIYPLSLHSSSVLQFLSFARRFFFKSVEIAQSFHD